jgi:TonB-linked SusC/RagA family outer membrane protein
MKHVYGNCCLRLDFSFFNQNYMLMKKIILFVSFLSTFTFATAQNRTITGQVVDDKGSGIANASVVVKGTSVGTITNANGSFSLSVPANARTIVVSYIGMGEREIALTNNNTYDVSLSATKSDLQEVVVVGYGTQKRANLTGSQSSVKPPDIENRPFPSVDQMLGGKVPGLQAPQFTGQPGAAQNIRIRGTGSVSAGANPLYVVDGIIVNSGDLSRVATTANSIAGINANDIESVTVLKDAQSTSIYGSRGANGVIVITTKKGKAGKTKFRADAEAGFTSKIELPEGNRFLNAQEYIALLEEGVRNSGGSQTQVDAIAAQYGKGNGVDTDWLDLVTKQGTQQQYNLSATGGDAKNQFYLSGGYFNQEANVIGSDFKRYSLRTNYKHVASDRLSFTFIAAGSNVIQHTPNSGGAFANPVGSLPFLRPTQNPYNTDGTLNISRTGNNFSSQYNPLYIAQYNRNDLNSTQLEGSISGEFAILKNLKFTSRFGVDYNNLEEYRFWNQYHGDGVSYGGSGDAYNTRYFNWIATNQLDYFTTAGRDGNFRIDAKLGYEAQKSKQYNVSTRTEGFPPPNSLYLTINAATVKTASNNIADYDFAGLYSAGSVSYQDKYILSGSYRRDGSSRFSEEKRYGNFWSVGAAWNADKENFLSNVSFISALKLRGSYGLTGNASGIGNYAWRQTYGFGSNYNGLPGGTFNVVGNSDLQWESTYQGDIGLDASFLDNRISIIFDVYNRLSDHLIFADPISPTTGFLSVTRNIGKLQNKGYEFTLDATPLKFKDFTWNISFNITHNTNTVKKLPGGKDIIDGSFILREGHDYRTFYVREWDGVNPANGNPSWWVDSSHKTATGTYASAQRQLIGSASPSYFGGFSSTFTYKGFDLDAEFVYNYGNLVRDQWIFYTIDGVDPTSNKTAINLQRWQKPGDITNVPKYVYGSTNSSSSFSTRFLYKGDFIRLRNITLGYNLSEALSSRIKLSSVRIYVRGTNLWTKTYDKDLTLDPEAGVNSTGNLDVFFNRIITAGVNIGF